VLIIFKFAGQPFLIGEKISEIFCSQNLLHWQLQGPFVVENVFFRFHKAVR